MAENQVITPGSLAAIVTRSLASPRQFHFSVGTSGGLPVLLGEASHLFATPATGRFKPGSVPPARSKSLLKPPLLQALAERSTEKVRMALESDPESARFPFWDHDLEQPLCCAVRNDCCSDIIEMLLTSGADASTADRRGNLPLALLICKIADMEAPSPLAGVFEDHCFEGVCFPKFTMPSLPLASAALEDKLRCRELLEAALAA
eukprot:TRINITY_DN22760_c0_g2_i3.p1 TRINITY_DN22760_c0_g2~~TRINITY_DN22760_c0_g2_i3.p1  ORF type:complete len:205 (+),score=43.50 TRINITY_DN22760_c0_g2_i3:247-861(+)